MKKFKEKACKGCGASFNPTAPCNQYCTKKCRDAAMYEIRLTQRKASEVRTGKNKNPGVGQGGSNLKGKLSYNYKPDAEHRYREFKKSACERCESTKYLCVHHIDRNRLNNDPKNLETLCKKCHQIEHECIKNIPKERTPEQLEATRQKHRLNMLARQRDDKGRIICQK